MANPTMTLIASNTVGSGGAASINFTSIPATYTDIVVKLSFAGGDITFIQFNGITTNVYTYNDLRGSGSAAASFSTGTWGTPPYGIAIPYTSASPVFSSAEFYVPNYAGSTQKSVSHDGASEANATTAYAMLTAGLWTGTAAITSIKVLSQSGNFSQYSTAYLYGIRNS